MKRIIPFLLAAAGVCCQPANAGVPACSALKALMTPLPAGPVFLASFPAETSGPLNQVAFLYDNAVATIGLVACGDTPAASRIGAAMLAALDHDRFWHDGRLRNGYRAGPVAMPLKMAGWWDRSQKMWVEDQYQVGSDSGNLAWAMLALLALHRAGAGPRYLEGARRIGAYVARSYDRRRPAGFMGGTFGDQPAPVSNAWKSTEHNTDLAAAFRLLADATGDPHWRELSRRARNFVAAMWSAECQCFDAGTAADGKTHNRQRALDAQIWPLLAIPGGMKRFAAARDSAARLLSDDGGYAYSDAKEGLWTEGTAQMALLMRLSGRDRASGALLAAVERNRAPDGYYYAASPSRLPTGFMLQTDPGKPRLYFHIPHLAPLAWTALAQEGFNPFTGGPTLPASQAAVPHAP